MLIFCVTIFLAGITVKLLPSIKLRGLFIIYYSLLYLTLAGVEGLLTIDKNDKFSANVDLSVNLIIFFLHLPLIVKLYQLDHKKKLISTARDIFGEHVWHMDDHKLHKQLSGK